MFSSHAVMVNEMKFAGSGNEEDARRRGGLSYEAALMEGIVLMGGGRWALYYF